MAWKNLPQEKRPEKEKPLGWKQTESRKSWTGWRRRSGSWKKALKSLPENISKGDFPEIYQELQEKNQHREQYQEYLEKIDTAIEARRKSRENGTRIIQEERTEKARVEAELQGTEKELLEKRQQIREKAGDTEGLEEKKEGLLREKRTLETYDWRKGRTMEGFSGEGKPHWAGESLWRGIGNRGRKRVPKAGGLFKTAYGRGKSRKYFLDTGSSNGERGTGKSLKKNYRYFRGFPFCKIPDGRSQSPFKRGKDI